MLQDPIECEGFQWREWAGIAVLAPDRTKEATDFLLGGVKQLAVLWVEGFGAEGTQIYDRATPTFGRAGPTYIPAMQYQPMMGMKEVGLWDAFQKLRFHGQRGLALTQACSVGDPKYMCVNGHGGPTKCRV